MYYPNENFSVFFDKKVRRWGRRGQKNRQGWRFSYEVVGAISLCVSELPAYFQTLLCRVHSGL